MGVRTRTQTKKSVTVVVSYCKQINTHIKTLMQDIDKDIASRGMTKKTLRSGSFHCTTDFRRNVFKKVKYATPLSPFEDHIYLKMLQIKVMGLAFNNFIKTLNWDTPNEDTQIHIDTHSASGWHA